MDKWKVATSDSAIASLKQQTIAPTVARSFTAAIGAVMKRNEVPTSELSALPSEKMMTEISSLQQKLKRATDEIVMLKNEKKVWLSRIQADNRKLGLMFQDVEEAKRRMIQEIDNIQTEKSRLRALQINVSEENLDALIRQSRLNPTAQKLLPVAKRAQAGALYDKLTQLITKCRENQVEVLQVVLQKAQEAEAGFQAGTDAGIASMEAALTALTSIASTLPGNLLAAESVAVSLSDAMVCALMEKSSFTLARRAESIGLDPLANDSSGSGMAGSGGHVGHLDIKALQAQNESLRTALQTARKRNNELLTKAQGEIAAAVKAKEQALKGTRTKTDPNSHSSTASKNTASRTSAEHGSSQLLHEHSDAVPELDADFFNKDLNALSDSVSTLVLERTADHVLLSLQGNPLSTTVDPSVKKEIAIEIASRMSGVVDSMLHEMIAHGEVDAANSKSVAQALVKVLASPIRKCTCRCHAPFFIHPSIHSSTHALIYSPICPFPSSLSQWLRIYLHKRLSSSPTCPPASDSLIPLKHLPLHSQERRRATLEHRSMLALPSILEHLSQFHRLVPRCPQVRTTAQSTTTSTTRRIGNRLPKQAAPAEGP